MDAAVSGAKNEIKAVTSFINSMQFNICGYKTLRINLLFTFFYEFDLKFAAGVCVFDAKIKTPALPARESFKNSWTMRC